MIARAARHQREESALEKDKRAEYVRQNGYTKYDD